MVLPWKTCESRGLALHNAEGQGAGSASLGTESWGHQDPLAALQIPLHPGTGRGKVGALGAVRGVPGAALPGSVVPAECVPPGFIGVLLF